MNKVLFNQLGGFPMQLDYLQYAQDSIYDHIGELGSSLCLGAENVLFSAPSYSGGVMSWPGGFIMLGGKLLYVPAQNISGIIENNFYFVPQVTTSHPRDFKDGTTRDVYQHLSAQLVYATAAPANGTQLAGMVKYADYLRDGIVKPVTDPMQQTVSNHAQTISGMQQNISANGQAIQTLEQAIDNKVSNLATPWKNIILRPGYVVSEGARYRINSIGNLEIQLSISRDQFDDFFVNIVGTFQPEDEYLYDEFKDITSNIRVSASGVSSQKFARAIGDIWLDNYTPPNKYLYVSSLRFYDEVTGNDRRFAMNGMVTFFKF